MPAAPAGMGPSTRSCCSRPMAPAVTVPAKPSRAKARGAGASAPSPVVRHPPVKRRNRVDGRGRGASCPMEGRRDPSRCRLPASSTTAMAPHTTTGTRRPAHTGSPAASPVSLSCPGGTSASGWGWSPGAVGLRSGASWPRKKAESRALPRACRRRTSASGRTRRRRTRRRPARTAPRWPRFHIQAPAMARVVSHLPVHRARTSSTRDSSASCGSTRNRCHLP